MIGLMNLFGLGVKENHGFRRFALIPGAPGPWVFLKESVWEVK